MDMNDMILVSVDGGAPDQGLGDNQHNQTFVCI